MMKWANVAVVSIYGLDLIIIILFANLYFFYYKDASV